MNREQESIMEQSLKENMEKVRMAGMLAGAKGVAGAILEKCKKKQNPALTVKEIEAFCRTSLGLKGEPKEKPNETT